MEFLNTLKKIKKNNNKIFEMLDLNNHTKRVNDDETIRFEKFADLL